MASSIRAALGGALVGAIGALAYVAWRGKQRFPTLLSLTSSGGAGPPRGPRTPGEPVQTQGILELGKVAVITGAASGIGRAVARKCVGLGMRVLMADVQAADLERVRRECILQGARAEDVVTQIADVSRELDMLSLRETAYRVFGRVHFLLNNAGLQNNGDASVLEHPDRWRTTMEVNFFGVFHGCRIFGERMVAQGEPAVIVNTGSKQGITMPPGDTAYNCSKAAVKCLTEGLQHTLRNLPSYADCPVNAFLLVPGWTMSMITTRADQRNLGNRWDPQTAQDEQSYDGNQHQTLIRDNFARRGAWMPEQVADKLFDVVNAGGPFYIICEDNETTEAMDNMRIQWTADDLIERRQPLSRWSDQYRDEYAAVAAKVA